MVLFCKVQKGMVAMNYATGDRVFLGPDNKWVAERRDAAQFATFDDLLHAVATFTLKRGLVPPKAQFTGFGIDV